MSTQMVDTIFSYHNNIDTVSLYGGEPLQPRTKNIVEYIISKKPNAFYGITTNGYYIEEFLPLLSKIKIKQIMITLDGERKVHNETRVMPQNKNGTFDRIIAGINELLIKSGKVSPFISPIIRPQLFEPKYTGCSAEEYARFYDAEGYIYLCNCLRK